MLLRLVTAIRQQTLRVGPRRERRLRGPEGCLYRKLRFGHTDGEVRPALDVS
jgi:hypothetical protein